MGNVVEVRQRPNDFTPPPGTEAGSKTKRDKRGIEARSRESYCPPDIDLLQYAEIDVPDFDPNKNLRPGASCSAK